MSGIMDNRSVLAKADMALADLIADGGYLVPEQAQKFIRVLIQESVLMKQATVVPMKSPKQLIEKIRFGSRVLRAGTEASALPIGDRAKPDLSKVELDAQLFKAEVRLDNETLEDSIERDQLRQTIMQLMAEAISRDIDEVLVRGDVLSADPFLAKINGVLKQATSNVVDGLSQKTNKSMFRDMLKSMPSEFLRNKNLMKFFTSIDSKIDYVDSLGDRIGVLGDKMLMDGGDASYSGVPIMDVPLFPENLGVGSNLTNMLLTDPKNIHVGMWRNIRLETDKLVSEGVLIIVATLRFDVKFVEERAVVKTTNVKVGA